MKKLILFALLGLLILGGTARLYAQEDSAKAAEQPKDTISTDNMDSSIYYSDDTPKKSSNTMTYAIVGGIVVVGGAVFYFIRKKKKQS